MPLFPNSSDAQTFLGSFDGHDLYFDPQIGIPTVIARFGPEGADYKSGMEFALRGVDRHLVEARRRALERGLIADELKRKPS
jgi:hypothetical protein